MGQTECIYQTFNLKSFTADDELFFSFFGKIFLHFSFDCSSNYFHFVSEFFFNDDELITLFIYFDF